MGGRITAASTQFWLPSNTTRTSSKSQRFVYKMTSNCKKLIHPLMVDFIFHWNDFLAFFCHYYFLFSFFCCACKDASDSLKWDNFGVLWKEIIANKVQYIRLNVSRLILLIIQKFLFLSIQNMHEVTKLNYKIFWIFIIYLYYISCIDFLLL